LLGLVVFAVGSERGFRYSMVVSTRLPILPVLLVAGCASSPFPYPVVPEQPSSADWPDASIAVLQDEATLEFVSLPVESQATPRVIAVLDHRRRLKILSEAGLAAATLELPVDQWSRLQEVRARSVSAEGAIEELRVEDAVELPWPGAREAVALRRLRFTVPGAAVGGLIDYRYQRVFDDPAFVPAWVFGGPYPVLHSEFAVVAEPEMRVDFRFARGPQPVEVTPVRSTLPDGRRRLVFAQRDLPPFYDERAMPHPAHGVPWLAVTLASQPDNGQKLETWEDVGRHLRQYLRQVKGEAESGSATHLFRAVRDSIHAIDFTGVGGLAPTPAGRLMAGAPACSRDAAALLLDSMRNSDAEAVPALVAGTSGPPPLRDLPGFYSFVRVLVAVRATGPAADRSTCGRNDDTNPVCRSDPQGYLFLDPACASCRYGEVAPDVAGGQVLVLARSGPEWTVLPLDPPEAHTLRLQQHLSFGSDGRFYGTLEVEARGATAGRLRALWLISDGGKRDKAIAAAVNGAGGPEMLEAQLTSTTNSMAEQPLALRAQVQGNLERLGSERFRARPVDLIGPAFGSGWRRTRHFDVVLDGPSVAEHVINIDLPAGYKVEEPPPVRLSNRFVDYTSGFQHHDRTLSYSRRVRIKTHEVALEDWDELRDFFEQVQREEEKGARLWARD
jgi:hypothetical protein